MFLLKRENENEWSSTHNSGNVETLRCSQTSRRPMTCPKHDLAAIFVEREPYELPFPYYLVPSLVEREHSIGTGIKLATAVGSPFICVARGWHTTALPLAKGGNCCWKCSKGVEGLQFVDLEENAEAAAGFAVEHVASRPLVIDAVPSWNPYHRISVMLSCDSVCVPCFGGWLTYLCCSAAVCLGSLQYFGMFVVDPVEYLQYRGDFQACYSYLWFFQYPLVCSPIGTHTAQFSHKSWCCD